MGSNKSLTWPRQSSINDSGSTSWLLLRFRPGGGPRPAQLRQQDQDQWGEHAGPIFSIPIRRVLAWIQTWSDRRMRWYRRRQRCWLTVVLLALGASAAT